jgi:hypothetical protein
MTRVEVVRIICIVAFLLFSASLTWLLPPSEYGKFSNAISGIR